jgi:glutathione peroxidase
MICTHSNPPDDIKWNFNKFLIDKQGNIAARFEPKIVPSDPALIAKIEDLLAK